MLPGGDDKGSAMGDTSGGKVGAGAALCATVGCDRPSITPLSLPKMICSLPDFILLHFQHPLGSCRSPLRWKSMFFAVQRRRVARYCRHAPVCFVLFSECFETVASWQHCIGHNTTSAFLSEFGATPAAQVSGGQIPPSAKQGKQESPKQGRFSPRLPTLAAHKTVRANVGLSRKQLTRHR